MSKLERIGWLERRVLELQKRLDYMPFESEVQRCVHKFIDEPVMKIDQIEQSVWELKDFIKDRSTDVFYNVDKLLYVRNDHEPEKIQYIADTLSELKTEMQHVWVCIQKLNGVWNEDKPKDGE